jgi:hypothetical protein
MRSLRATTILSSRRWNSVRCAAKRVSPVSSGYRSMVLVQVAESGREPALGFHIMPEALRLGDEAVRVQDGHDFITGRHDLVEHLALAGSLPSHSLDQRRHLVGPLAVLVLHLGPGLLRPLFQSGNLAMAACRHGQGEPDSKTPSYQAREQYLLRPCRAR